MRAAHSTVLRRLVRHRPVSWLIEEPDEGAPLTFSQVRKIQLPIGIFFSKVTQQGATCG